MNKKLLLSAILTFAVATTTASAQSVDAGCGCNGAASTACNAGDCGSSVGVDYFAAGSSDCCTSKYARAFVGWNFVEDFSEPIIGAVTADLDFASGWAGGLALGRRNGIRRTELELTHRHNSFDQLIGGVLFAQGNLSTAAVMANVMFDLTKLERADVNVYGGGGLGLSYADLHVTTPVDDSAYDTGFAYQAIAGVEKELQRGRKAFIEYRYFVSEFNFGTEAFDYEAHNIFFGLEFRR